MSSNCVIMSMDEIERMFCQIERRIGVHERDVVVLEDRSRAFNVWWMEQGKVEAPKVIEEESQTEEEIQRKTKLWMDIHLPGKYKEPDK